MKLNLKLRKINLNNIYLKPSSRAGQKKRNLPLNWVNVQDEWTLEDGFILKANTVVITKNLCGVMNVRIHSSHLGTESKKSMWMHLLAWNVRNQSIHLTMWMSWELNTHLGEDRHCYLPSAWMAKTIWFLTITTTFVR